MCFVLVFSVLLALRIPRMGKRELILVHFVRFFELRLFGFVYFLFLSVCAWAAACDCGTPWTFLSHFKKKKKKKKKKKNLCDIFVVLFMFMKSMNISFTESL